MRLFSRGLAAAVLLAPALAQAEPQHNLVLFVADGLRAHMVRPDLTPAMAQVRDRGVNFVNSHAIFPTFTTANAAAIATGHFPGDTGDYSNFIYAGFPVAAAGGSVAPFLESNPVLAEVDAHFAGNFLDEDTVLRAARQQGYQTVAIGKLGPTLIFDHTIPGRAESLILDDQTGTEKGVPLPAWATEAMGKAGLAIVAPGRGDNGKAGDLRTPGAKIANVDQQRWFADAATKVVLPKLKADGKPFLLVFWSRDPDGTQHSQGDSLGQLTPGINGPTSLAAIRNADDNLANLRAALDAQGLAETTDIIVAADHGFSVISKESATSPAAKRSYADVPAGALPTGFVAIDLAAGLGLPLFDPDRGNAAVAADAHPRLANGMIGPDPARPQIVVAGNGGSDLVYLPTPDKELGLKAIQLLLAQDYVSGLFVNEDLFGAVPGTLPLASINLKGRALTPTPAIVVNFRSFATGCGDPLVCTAEVADTGLQQGQGMHGSFSRADTQNFMAAIGPSFKAGFVDEAPVSNADLGLTMAAVLKLKFPFIGVLQGRVIEEAMPGGATPEFAAATLASAPSEAGLRTVLRYQTVGKTRYFDAAGFPGRTVGLE